MKKIALMTLALISLSANANTPPDRSSPESVLDGYMQCLEIASDDCVLKYYHGIDSFHIKDNEKVTYKIVKKITFDSKDAKRWNTLGIIPQAKVGDVELSVDERYQNGNTGRGSYNLRKINGDWYIIAHSASDIEYQ